MASSRTASPLEGFGRSPIKPFVVATAANGSLVPPVDLETNYAFIVVRAPSTAIIPATTSFSLRIGDFNEDELLPLLNFETGGLWNSGTLPTTGGFRVVIPAAFGAQRVRLVLSNVLAGSAITFNIYGLDPVLKDNRRVR